MLSIKEVATLFEVSTRTIRYYEELGLLKPKRSLGNIRFFHSRDMGFTIGKTIIRNIGKMQDYKKRS